MARLPVPDSDDGTWGVILNDFLAQVHNSDGSLKDGVISPSKLSSSNLAASGDLLSYNGSGLEWVTGSLGGNPAMGGDLSGNASNAQIVANAVGPTELAANAVITAKIADSNVTTAKIADSNVTTAKIADTNITTGKLADGAVTDAKVASGIAQSKITNLTTDLAGKASSSHAHALDDLTDVTLGTPTNGQVLKFNGTAWAAAADSTGGGGGGPLTTGVITVASSEAPQALKDASNYVCTGTNDQTIINQALLQASRAADGFGGEGYIGVHLVGPMFYVGNNGTTSITMYPSTHLFGSGPGTLIRPMWPTNVDRGCIELLNSETAHVRVSNLSIGKVNATYSNGSGIKFVGTGVGDAYEIKTANDPYCVIDHVMTLFMNRKGIYATGTTGGMREIQISHCILWSCMEEGILVEGSSDCQISDCRANGGGSYPRFSLSGGNSKIANCKSYYSGGSSSQNADGFLISSSRCEVVGCSAQDNGRYGFNISSSNANISGCTADSNSRLQSDGGGFLISSYCSAQGLVAFDRGQTPGSPQTSGIIFSGTPQVNVTGFVDVPSGTNHVVGSVDTNSFVRIVRRNSTIFSTN